MKKIFKLTDEKKHPDRVLEAVKHDIRKYIKRERKKKLPDASEMYWDFDCRIGTDAASAQAVEFDALIKALERIQQTGTAECYVEIVAKAVEKPTKSASVSEEEA